jgi:hypothetical protein
MAQLISRMVQQPHLLDHQVWVAQALVVLLVLRQMPQVRGIMEIVVMVPVEP